MRVSRALAERIAASLTLLALGYTAFGGELLGDRGLLLLVVASLSLVLPGLGVMALALPVLVSRGPNHPLTLLLAAPAIVLALRFWPQASAWVAAVGLEEPLISCTALAALVFSVRFASPGAAAILMLFYALSAGFKLSTSAPPGALWCQRLVVAQGLTSAPEGEWIELAGEWFFSNLLGPPRLLLLALTYAAAGAAASKLRRLEAARLAGVLPPLIMLLALNIVTRSIGIKLSTESLAVLAASAAMTLVSEVKREKPPRAKVDSLSVASPPPAIPPHLECAWTALREMLAGGERLILVFGPSGCGKTTVIREALRACKAKSANPPNVRGRVVHLENAEKLENLENLIRKLLASGARCVVLETSRPATLMRELRSLTPRKAVYVMPPDEEARSTLLAQTLDGVLDEDTVAWLARAAQRYSLKGLAKLAERIRANLRNSSEPQQAIIAALQETPPDLSYEELAECEQLIATYRGVIAGFSRGYACSGIPARPASSTR